MRFCVLSSGSRANSTFIETASSRALIDCGLSCAQVEKRLRSIGVDPATINAIFITHEHRDHVYGVPAFARRYRGVKVYVNAGTARALHAVPGLPIPNLQEFGSAGRFTVQDLAVTPISISHDAAEPVGFRFESAGFVLSQITDLGEVTTIVRESLRGTQALIIESNHDEELLKVCHYPWVLKRRILSSQGHLCNSACGELIASIMHGELVNLVLGHISENSNTPAVAVETVCRYLPARLAKTLICASVYKPTAVFKVGEAGSVSDKQLNLPVPA